MAETAQEAAVRAQQEADAQAKENVKLLAAAQKETVKLSEKLAQANEDLNAERAKVADLEAQVAAVTATSAGTVAGPGTITAGADGKPIKP